MMGESNQKRSNGTGRDIKISNSRAMGVIVLIALLFVFQTATFVWHKVQDARLADGATVSVAGAFGADTTNAGAAFLSVGQGRFAPGGRFAFDPNSISADSLQLLGFSAKQAQSIIKYRVKGGKFRYREDFSRLYVVDSAVYAALEEYIVLPHRGSGAKGAGGVPGGVSGGAVGRTKVAQNVRQKADSLDRGPKRESHPGREPVSEDMSGSIYGKKVERNRYMCNLNTADSAALVQLYGIGGYYARKILRYREMLGGSFVDARQLLEIEGFTQERFAKIEKNVFVRSDDVKGFSILNAERKALERHPYIGPYAARGIVTYLKLKGKESFENEMHLLEQLVKEKIIGEGNAQKLREYLLHL